MKHCWQAAGGPAGLGLGLGVGTGVGTGCGTGVGTGVGVGVGVGLGLGVGEGPLLIPRQLTMLEYGMFWQCPPEAKWDSEGFPSCGHFVAKY